MSYQVVDAVYMVGAICLVCAACVAIVMGMVFSASSPKPRSVAYACATVIVFVVCALVSFVGAFVLSRHFEHPGTEYQVAVVENGRVVEVVRDQPVWCYERDCRRLPLPSSVRSIVSPITDNPKVRTIEYTVNVEICEESIFISQFGEMSLAQQREQMNGVVQYALYEFNNSESKELAELYNPLNPHQTKAFNELINGNLVLVFLRFEFGLCVQQIEFWDVR